MANTMSITAIRMPIRTTMTTSMTDAGTVPRLLRLLTWASPTFPTGAFSYSHGIEFAVEEGLITNRAQLQSWVGWIARYGALYADTVLFVHAFRAAVGDDTAAFDDIAALAAAMRSTAESAMESKQQGASFFATARAVWPSKRMELFAARNGSNPALPIAVALLCAGTTALADSAAAYLHSAMTNLVSAGLRLIPLGQTDGQRCIAALEATVTETVARALETDIDDLATAAPVVDWTSMCHESQYTRLFRS